MNKKTAYEVTITGKLKELPLPDNMEDVIWARIKTQLDEDMPTDDGGESPDVPSGGGGWYWSAGSVLFMAALTAVFFLTKKPTPNQQTPLFPQTIQTATPLPAVEQNSDPPPPSPPPNNALPPVTPGGNLPLVTSPLSTPLTGAAPAVPIAGLPMPDSLRQTTVLSRPPLLLDTTAARKKPRGVSGITDNDYRIVPEKDSL